MRARAEKRDEGVGAGGGTEKTSAESAAAWCRVTNGKHEQRHMHDAHDDGDDVDDGGGGGGGGRGAAVSCLSTMSTSCRNKCVASMAGAAPPSAPAPCCTHADTRVKTCEWGRWKALVKKRESCETEGAEQDKGMG